MKIGKIFPELAKVEISFPRTAFLTLETSQKMTKKESLLTLWWEFVFLMKPLLKQIP